MTTVSFRKGMVLTVICLFIGAGVVPGISGNIRKTGNKLYDKENYVSTDFKNTGGQTSYLIDPPEEEWNRTFGGYSFNSVQQTLDEGYIMVGTCDLDGDLHFKVWLVKTDSSGYMIWNRTFSCEYGAQGYYVQQTLPDEGYIIVATRYDLVFRHDRVETNVWLIKTNKNGSLLWDYVIGGDEYDDFGYCVDQTVSGGYIIAGHTAYIFGGSGSLLLIYNHSAGDFWFTTFEGLIGAGGRFVQQTFDKGFIVTGYIATSWDSSDLWLLKTNSNGIESWNTTFEKPTPETSSSGFCVKQTFDEGYIIVGSIRKHLVGRSDDVWLIKTDKNGTDQWKKIIGGTAVDLAHSVCQTYDGGYILAGETGSYGHFGKDAWLVKTDSDGNESWNITIGGQLNDEARCIQQTKDGGYIIAGSTLSFGDRYAWLIKISPDVPLPMSVYVDDDFDSSTTGWQITRFDKIQDGINRVAGNGNVYVNDGSYVENVIISKPINLLGWNKETTIIDGGGIPLEEGAAISVSANNVNISGFTIINNGSQVREPYAGIRLTSCSNNTISDNIFLGSSNYSINDAGIFFNYSSSNIFEDNIFQHFSFPVYSESSINNSILNNIILNCGHGICLCHFSCDNIISGNNISNIMNNDRIGVGIYLDNDNINNIISGNKISNKMFGMFLQYSSSNNQITGNIIDSNSDQGIRLFGNCCNNNISVNTISNNSFGVFIINNCNDNLLFQNNFINNTNNSHDECNNTWDNGSSILSFHGFSFGGNYWDDYREKYPDATNNSYVWYTSYEIPGGNNKDRYPLVEPWISENQPPDKPITPSGPTSGKPNTEYTYSSSTTDPDGDKIQYLFDWGDGQTSAWTDPVNSGQPGSASHKWTIKGTYQIKVKTRDIPSFKESDWSDPLAISMPKNKAINPFLLFLERLMERFPILEQILQPIIYHK